MCSLLNSLQQGVSIGDEYDGVGGDAVRMVALEGEPVLRRGFSSSHHVWRWSIGAHNDPGLEQFPMDPRCAPKRVVPLAGHDPPAALLPARLDLSEAQTRRRCAAECLRRGTLQSKRLEMRL